MTRGSHVPVWLVLAGAAALAFFAALVASSLSRETPVGYPISDLRPRPEPSGLTSGRLTLDARDPRRWIRLDLSRAALVPDIDPASWDIAVRRFRIVVNGGTGFVGGAGVIAIGDQSFATLSEAPGSGYRGSEVSRGGDTTTVALERWYEYGFLSHLLQPRPTAYVLRTSDGRFAKFRILGYYCPAAEPGCLTLEYVYQGDGSRRLAE